MKTGIRIATILIFIVLGWFLAEYVLKWFLSPIHEIGLVVQSTKPLEQFQLRTFFALILGLVPVLIWILSRFLNYRNRFFEVFGYFFILNFGLVSLKLRSMSFVASITSIPKAPFNEIYTLSELKINQFWLLGITIGCILFVVLGLFLKQMTLKEKNEKQKRLAEEDIGRIGKN